MTDVTNRVDDRWARLTLLLWSQHEVEQRERPNQQDGGYCRSTDVLGSGLSATEGSESIRQVGKLLDVPATSCDGEAQQLEGGEVAARESPGGGGNRQEDGRAEA